MWVEWGRAEEPGIARSQRPIAGPPRAFAVTRRTAPEAGRGSPGAAGRGSCFTVAGNMLAGPQPCMYHNLRVDDHPDPAAASRRIDELIVEHSRLIEREHDSAGARLFGRIKH